MFWMEETYERSCTCSRSTSASPPNTASYVLVAVDTSLPKESCCVPVASVSAPVTIAAPAASTSAVAVRPEPSALRSERRFPSFPATPPAEDDVVNPGFSTFTETAADPATVIVPSGFAFVSAP